jgi:hypothetical protein
MLKRLFCCHKNKINDADNSEWLFNVRSISYYCKDCGKFLYDETHMCTHEDSLIYEKEGGFTRKICCSICNYSDYLFKDPSSILFEMRLEKLSEALFAAKEEEKRKESMWDYC